MQSLTAVVYYDKIGMLMVHDAVFEKIELSMKGMQLFKIELV